MPSTPAGHVFSATCPPLLRVDVLAPELHRGISRELVRSAKAATPSIQQSLKGLPESCPVTWMHTIQNVRTVVPWSKHIHGLVAAEREVIAPS